MCEGSPHQLGLLPEEGAGEGFSVDLHAVASPPRRSPGARVMGTPLGWRSTARGVLQSVICTTQSNTLTH